jgi:aldose 1-epimerase
MTVRLSSAGAALIVDPAAGGRLASLVVAGRERLITAPDPTAPLPSITWGSFAMLPWVGRMRDGHLVWHGTDVRLPRNLAGHAIHGATYDRAWTVIDQRSDAVELELRFGPSDRWPVGATARQRIRLMDGGLDQRIVVEADAPMPVAVGWHPWFRRDPGEAIRVVVPAPTVLETTADLIPTGGLVAVDDLTDLRSGAPIGERRLDHAYVAVDGPCSIAWTDLELTMTAAPLTSVVVHSPPGSVCLEPQTAWPDAIRLGVAGYPSGLRELGSGATFEASTTWSWRR